MKRTWIWTVWGLLIAFGLSSSFQPAKRPPLEGPIKTLIIDAGHGGIDPGSSGKRYVEKDIALRVARKLRKLVKTNLPGVKVVLTRSSDHFIPLHKRGDIAQKHDGDFFVSIHCNGLSDKSKFGTETYVLGINEGQENYARIISENESILFEDDHKEKYGGFDPSSPEGLIYFRLLKMVYRKESVRLAQKIQNRYEHDLGRKSRGVKQGPFVVLYRCGMPAILTELGFITNEDEERFLASRSGQNHLATAIFEAIEEYNSEF